MNSHHPSQHLLAEFSAGSLSFGPALCVSTHTESCHECTQQLNNLSLLGASLMEDQQNIKVSDDLFDRVFDKVNQADAALVNDGVKETRAAALNVLLPQGLDTIPWEALAGGVSSHTLDIGDPNHRVKLLRVAKGRGVFTHTHTDVEYTALLQGGYSDELGSFTAGDFVQCDGSHRHAPVAHRDQDCILLTAVEGNLKFTGLLTRLINPFFKF